MLRLTDRLLRMAGCVEVEESVADIGTDHGLVPIYLYTNHISSRLIMTDVNEGPLAKAKINVELYSPEMIVDFRKGDGLKPIDIAEVDTAIIAGMGGRLIVKILEADPLKTKSIKKLILQPRNGQEKLRRFLYDQGYKIADEHLVRERNFICEVLVVRTDEKEDRDLYKEHIDYEISPLLFEKNEELLREFIQKKLIVEEGIVKKIIENGNHRNEKRIAEAKYRIEALKSLKDKAASLK